MTFIFIACVCVHVRVHVCMHACMHACMPVVVYVYIQLYMHIQIAEREESGAQGGLCVTIFAWELVRSVLWV